jgi:phosphoglycerate dehydrogenase-like enzyme
MPSTVGERSRVVSVGRKVLVYVHTSLPMTEAHAAAFEALSGVEVHFFESSESLEARADEAEVIASPRFSAEALGRAKNLRWLSYLHAGVDAVLYPEMLASDVTLTSVKGDGAIPLAEHAIMLMLMLNHGAVGLMGAQREHRWNRIQHGELNGLTCGIIGLGNSGIDLAEKAKAFHMTVIGVRRSERPAQFVDEIYAVDDLEEFLGRSDFVVVTAPRTEETKGMIGERQLRAMRPGACVIAFSRGGIIDEPALLTALREGRIAGAGLDVFADEPLGPDSPWWTAPNTIVTPHCGAITAATAERGIDILLENLRRYLADEPLMNVVDKIAGY